jgi:hypothetical protein
VIGEGPDDHVAPGPPEPKDGQDTPDKTPEPDQEAPDELDDGPDGR